MGRGSASRWLKGLFGLKKDSNRESPATARLNAGLCHNLATIPPNISPTEAAWLGSCGKDKEQSKRAAADAAMVAAHAAVAVVKLTSRNGKGKTYAAAAAVRIQSVFRGYLARKALRALRGLVKVQAVVRGFLERKQAKVTLHSMQALVRAQATVRLHKIRSLSSSSSSSVSNKESRKSVDNLDTTWSRRYITDDPDPDPDSRKIVEMDTGSWRSGSRSRSGRRNLSISESMNDPSQYYYYSSASYSDWSWRPEEWKLSTARSTPRLRLCPAAERSYMENTQSFRAKVRRTHSAPRQRPDGGGKSRRVWLMEARNSLSGARNAQEEDEVVSFKNAVMGKLVLSRE